MSSSLNNSNSMGLRLSCDVVREADPLISSSERCNHLLCNSRIVFGSYTSLRLELYSSGQRLCERSTGKCRDMDRTSAKEEHDNNKKHARIMHQEAGCTTCIEETRPMLSVPFCGERVPARASWGRRSSQKARQATTLSSTSTTNKNLPSSSIVIIIIIFNVLSARSSLAVQLHAHAIGDSDSQRAPLVRLVFGHHEIANLHFLAEERFKKKGVGGGLGLRKMLKFRR